LEPLGAEWRDKHLFLILADFRPTRGAFWAILQRAAFGLTREL